MDRYIRKEQIYKSQANRVEVFKVLDTHTNSTVILKVTSTNRQEEIQAIATEVYMQASLQHPNICRVLDYFTEDCGSHMNCCIVLECIETDLMKDMQNRKKHKCFYTETELWEVLRQVSSALAYAKSMGIAHRDIKPANTLLSLDKACKLADFGSARYLSEATQGAYTIVGTPLYLSPQIRFGLSQMTDKVDYNPFQADVYSLGVMMVTLATLESPIKLTNLNNLERKIEETVGGIGNYSEEFRQTLRVMLRVREEERVTIEQIDAWFQPAVTYPQPENAYMAAEMHPSYAQSLPVLEVQSAPIPASPVPTDPPVHAYSKSLPQYQALQSTQPTAPMHSTTKCVKCRNTMQTQVSNRVPLPCGGVLCSPFCLKRLTDASCPVCHAQFNPEKYEFD